MSIVIALPELSELDGLIGFTTTMFMTVPNVLSLIVIILASTADWLFKAHYSKSGYPSFLTF
ncbi:hypothetical protein JCM18900_12996 [Psychrobacter sp. JCM 18900]|nr:hypothetical protein JCM18900_12996 [Psychrobacter sp. JCM 18900]